MTFQLLINGKPVHPTGGKPYIFSTRMDASQMGNLCYGNDYTVQCIETGEIYPPLKFTYGY